MVFASRSSETPIVGYRKMWLRIAKLGDLPADITPHVLRHSFASLAADLGYNEPTIASLLGHKTHSITSRCVHSADAVLLVAADPAVISPGCGVSAGIWELSSYFRFSNVRLEQEVRNPESVRSTISWHPMQPRVAVMRRTRDTVAADTFSSHECAAPGTAWSALCPTACQPDLARSSPAITRSRIRLARTR